METSKCALCDRPAAIHETIIEAGVALTRHYCKEHGHGVIPKVAVRVDAAGLRAAADYYRNLPVEERQHYELLQRLSRRGG